MYSYTLTLYTIFRNVLFVEGTIGETEKIPRSIAIILGEGRELPILFDPATRRFSAMQPLTPEDRPFALKPKVRMQFDDGGSEYIAYLSEPNLNAQSFWPLVNSVLAEMAKRPTGTILEIGSRARSGVSRRASLTPPGWNYVGFDVIRGENVDVVGDAHELSRHLPSESFDGVVAMAVLEHIMMPWKLAIELNKVLKIGACGVFVTHQAWPVHDQPWDFWRFSDTSWTAILNSKTGFEIIDARMREPAFLVAETIHPGVDHQNIPCYQSSCVAFRKTGPTSLTWDVIPSDITKTEYPPGELPLIS